ncbi:MAG: SIR2 family protein, partial [Chloroflexi bacterium]|nr:SIR2 family protein [Chloroflexota bacterium]
MPDSVQQAIHLLADLIVQGDCVVFLGNDLPLGYPDVAPPCRAEMAAALAKDLGMPAAGDLRLATVAQTYERQCGRQKLVERIKELVDQPSYRPAWLHQLAAELPVRGYVTTALDALLVEALKMRSRRSDKVVRDVDRSFTSETRASVVMLCGDCQQPDSLVLTPKDYQRLPHEVKNRLQVVLDFFNTKTILIVGYRLDDPLFQNLYMDVQASVGKFLHPMYAVYSGYASAPQETKDYWDGEGITILDTDPRVFLNELQAEVQKRQQAVEDRKAAPEPLQLLDKKPYKFLDAYTAADSDIFYGRDTDAALVWGKILSFRTMMLFGASGTGKTSLLQAAVAPRLEAAGYRVALTRVLDDPVKAVMHAVQVVRDGKPGATPLHLTGFFRGLGERERWVVLLDQFEEYFVRQVETERARFRDQVRACADDRALDVRFVFSLREDFVGHMQELRPAMPDLWVNSHRLMPLSRSEAILAVTAPAARTGLLYEPGLVEERLLRDLAERDGGVAPPNLQIVCQQLYQGVDEQTSTQAEALLAAWRASHPDLDVRFPARRAVTLAQYQASGGAHEILRKHLDDKLATLAGNNAQALEELREVLRALVQKTDSVSTKAALTAAEVAERADLPTTQAEEALKQLASQDVRLVRALDEGRRHELAHECLIERIQAWPESPQRVRARDIKSLLREHVKLGELLSRQLLERAWEERENPRLKLNADELELLLRSALAAGFEVAYWFQRACAAGVAPGIVLEGLKSDSFRTR